MCINYHSLPIYLIDNNVHVVLKMLSPAFVLIKNFLCMCTDGGKNWLKGAFGITCENGLNILFIATLFIVFHL